MISVSVIPQTLSYAGIGRSSDFVLLAARLPGILVFQWLSTPYIIYEGICTAQTMDSQHRVMSQILTAFPS